MTDTPHILICGCGALGSQIALHLARPERTFTLIDDDRVEEANLLTTVYQARQVGVYKVDALADLLWRKCRAHASASRRTLDRPPSGAYDLVVDTFDNPQARALTVGLPCPTVHVGVSEARTGALAWDARYVLPTGARRGENPVCTHALGAPILRLTAALAANTIEDFLATGRERDWVVTEAGRIYE